MALTLLRFSTPSWPWRPNRSQIRIAGPIVVLGTLGYAAALIATLPAEVIVKPKGASDGLHDATGTAWNGAASAGQGMTVRWRFAPFRSLVSFAIVNRVEVRTADTDLAGFVQLRPGHTIVRDLRGRVGWGAIKAVSPALPFTCDLGGSVDLRRLDVSKRTSTMQGRLLLEPGHCRTPFDNEATIVPPLVLETQGPGPSARAVLAQQGRRNQPLAELTLTPDHKVRFSAQPAGSTLLPSILTVGAAFEVGL